MSGLEGPGWFPGIPAGPNSFDIPLYNGIAQPQYNVTVGNDSLPSLPNLPSLSAPNFDPLGINKAGGDIVEGVGNATIGAANAVGGTASFIGDLSVSRIVTVVIGLIAIFAGFQLLGASSFADAIRSLKP